MKCIGVLAHPLRPQSFPVAHEIAASLRERHLTTHVLTEWEERDARAIVPQSDMVIAIGGDGSMLRAARVCAPYEVPVLGINMGQLGFLTEITSPKHWHAIINRVLDCDYWIEKRMMINASVLRQGKVVYSEDALNDVVISGNVVGRMVMLDTYIDKHWTTTYYADALVISTPTGSTAYALASGGPILPPELTNILIVPAAPHLSMDRPIVLSEGAVVAVSASSFNRHTVVLSADGQVICEFESGDQVQIQASEHQSHFVRLRGRNYFYRSLLDRLEPRVRRPGLDGEGQLDE